MNKKEVLEAVEKAYRMLDNILFEVNNIRDAVRNAHSVLEEIPVEVNELEEDEKEDA